MSSSKPVVVVEITGSITPSVILPRGESRTVVLDDVWQRRIDRGFVTVTARHEIKPAPAKKRTPTMKAKPADE